jgi:hypothetical protein
VILGLALLWVSSEFRSVPIVEAGSIDTRMSHSLVRVRGSIASRPYIRIDEPGLEYVSFLLKDGTGVVRVSLRGEDALGICHEKGACVKGARLDVMGFLQVRAGGEPKLFGKNVRGRCSWTSRF